MELNTVQVYFKEDIEIGQLVPLPPSITSEYNENFVISVGNNVDTIHLHSKDHQINLKSDRIQFQSEGIEDEKRAKAVIEDFIDLIDNELEAEIEDTTWDISYKEKVEFNIMEVFDEDFVDELNDIADEEGSELQTPGLRLNLVEDNDVKIGVNLSYRSPKEFRSNQMTIVSEKGILEKIKDVIKDE